MTKYTSLNGFSHNGKNYEIGEIFTKEDKNLSDYDIQFLIDYKKITIYVDKNVEEVEKEIKTEVVTENVKNEVIEDIKVEKRNRKNRKVKKDDLNGDF